MLDFWQRIKPKVILVDQKVVDDDLQLQEYIKEEQLRLVLPNLWIP